ncbi:MAG: sensor histidine kinase [Taibaiella sp.]|nr:sensor histidine kinase [Taibaiella sp.]
MRYFILILIALACSGRASAQTGAPGQEMVRSVSWLEDKDGSLNAAAAWQKPFQKETKRVSNFGLTKSVYWLKVVLVNDAHLDNTVLKIHNGILKEVTLFEPSGMGFIKTVAGESVPFDRKEFNTQFPVFPVVVPYDSSRTFLLRVSSNNVMELPLTAGQQIRIFDGLSKDQLFFGIYFGIICVMFFYNIFIFFTVRDRNYLYYVLYIATVGLVQACLKGYAAKFLWRNSTTLTFQMTNIALALSGIFSIFFVFNFLNVKENKPRLYRVLWGILVIYCVGILINLSGNYVIAQQMLQGNASLVSIAIMTVGIGIFRQGHRAALYFSISWSFFLTGVVIYILKDAGLLPYTNFTSNSILIGSAMEVALLSFALADRINTYRKEKELSQARALAVVQENEKLVREQNIVLEQRVNERTHELKLSNEELNKALTDLKEAETQLVESEKMASLGQLTAGIAHEINNPINFVTSNIKPLNRDVQIVLDALAEIETVGLSNSSVEEKAKRISALKDEIDFDYLKEEIAQLLKGISEGANRTEEIVKGLRIFSRLDEDDLKKADLNEGLDSTLVIANNLIGMKIKLERKYSGLPLVECYPGKLNQVFLNMFSNAVYAIRKKFGDEEGGILTVSTRCDSDNVYVSIADNGIGMDESTKKRLFEPFFTTKEVGEGTGLGMSIAYNTIHKHNGSINIISEINKGTEFIIKLPLIQN